MMKLPPMPSPNVPIIDPKTGLMNRIWYDWFASNPRGLLVLDARLIALEP